MDKLRKSWTATLWFICSFMLSWRRYN